jgi:hypothetical protein
MGRTCGACAYRKSHPAILMVQSAQDRSADDIPGPLNAARDRGILVQRQMSARAPKPGASNVRAKRSEE